MGSDRPQSALALLRTQRSHVLFVLNNAAPGQQSAFRRWLQGSYRQALLDTAGVLSVQQYEQHEVDITQGRHAPLPFRYLAVCSLSLDGAQQAESLIEKIATLHSRAEVAQAPATWLYYPLGEKVGRAPRAPAMLTLAFANAVPGQELAFREWYVTRHIRHAMNIPALVSGQCLERTQFQRAGALAASFAIIAMYEQEGSAEAIIESFASLPAGTLDFPALDLAPTRFAESVYRPL